MKLTFGKALLALPLIAGCTDPDAATTFAECETYVALWRDYCSACTGLEISQCEGFAYNRATGGRDSCQGVRPQEDVEDFWGSCIQPLASFSCTNGVGAEGGETEEYDFPNLPFECDLHYDDDLFETQETKEIGP